MAGVQARRHSQPQQMDNNHYVIVESSINHKVQHQQQNNDAETPLLWVRDERSLKAFCAISTNCVLACGFGRAPFCFDVALCLQLGL
jgi:hypothetical protein